MPSMVTLTGSKPPLRARRTVLAPRRAHLTFRAEPFDPATDNWQFNGADQLPAGATATGSTLTIDLGNGRSCYGTYAVKDKSGTYSDAWRVAPANLFLKLGQGWRTLVMVVVAIVVYVLLVLLLYSTRRDSIGVWIFGSLTLILAVVLLQCVLRSVPSDPRRGFGQLFVGDDRRASTSKTQYMLWTLFITFALSCMAGNALLNLGVFKCGEAAKTFCVDGAAWDQYLILLGVPAGTAVLAKGIVSYKVVNGIVQKSEGDGANLAQIGTNDQGAPDIVDVQYLLFNVVTLVFVIAGFVRTTTLGEVPPILLGLTSTAAATYVLNKSLQTTRPTITAVMPSTIGPRATVEIRGKYLFPDSDRDPIVKLGGVQADLLKADKRGNIISVMAPLGMATGNQTATVITAANVETEGYPIQVPTFAIQGATDLGKATATIDLVGAPITWSKAYVSFGARVIPGKKGGSFDQVTADLSGTTGTDDLVVTLDGQRTPPYRAEVAP